MSRVFVTQRFNADELIGDAEELPTTSRASDPNSEDEQNNDEQNNDELLPNDFLDYLNTTDHELTTVPTATGLFWIQITRVPLGPLDRTRWYDTIQKIVTQQKDERQKNIRLQLAPDPFTKLEKLHIRDILLYISAHEPTRKIVYCVNPRTTEFTIDEKDRIIHDCHNSTSGQHLGENKTIDKIRTIARWKNVEKDVRDYIRRCDTCQRYKLTRIRARVNKQ